MHNQVGRTNTNSMDYTRVRIPQSTDVPILKTKTFAWNFSHFGVKQSIKWLAER